jgi:hypothetical protein
MRKLEIMITNCGNNDYALGINYYSGILLSTLSDKNNTYISIHDVTKEELEYMASELKRIADTMEG